MGHLAQIKKMKLVHACGPYGNDCGGPSSFSDKKRTAALKLPTLPTYQHYTAALESMANSS